MKRALYDTNVVLDVLLEREPHVAASTIALNAVGAGTVEGYIAAHAVTTIAYLLQRQFGSAHTRTILADLLAKMRVAPVTDAAVRLALSSAFVDFEDGVCHAAAVEAQIDVIVTRDIADFAESVIPVVLPEAFRPD